MVDTVSAESSFGQLGSENTRLSHSVPPLIIRIYRTVVDRLAMGVLPPPARKLFRYH